MKEKRLLKGLFLSVILAVSNVGAVQAKTTTGDFLKWERKAQESFFQISISMAAFVLVQTKPDYAQCVENWYFRAQPQRNGEFLRDMADYKQYHPNAVLIGFMEQACGKVGG